MKQGIGLVRAVQQGAGTGIGWEYLEGALVGKRVDTRRPTARLAEEQQFLKEEDAAQGLVAPSTDHEFILTHQLPLFLEVNLQSWGMMGAQPLLRSSSTPTALAHHSLGWLTSQPWMASMASRSLPCRSWKCTRL